MTLRLIALAGIALAILVAYRVGNELGQQRQSRRDGQEFVGAFGDTDANLAELRRRL